MTGAKICGLKTPEAVAAAVDGGAAYVGFVVYGPSPRDIAPAVAARLATPARARNVQVVAVTVDPDDALLERIVGALAPDLIQLHGRESPARCAEVARRTGAGVVKALPVAVEADLDAARAYDGAAQHLMLDARPPPGATLPGGNGAAIEWPILRGFRAQRRWFLAGGLDPWNVAAAVAASSAPLVDVSSGVERGPGVKDPRLIAAFLDAVRAL